MSASKLSLLLIAAAISATACHPSPMLTTPESDQAAYAALYPERLRDARTRFAEDEAEARKSFDPLRALPSGASADNADELEQLVRRADAAGRSQHYVDEALRQEEVDTLMQENKGAIRRRVAGSVAATAKDLSKKEEKACLVEEDINALSGSAASGTDRAVARQLESRLRARNPAHQYLHAHADELGEQRVSTLERQVDNLSRASFLSNVRLALYRIELEDLLDQHEAVHTTLERDEAEGRAALAGEGLSKSHRLAIEEQVARDEAARAALGSEVAASQATQKELEGRAQALQKDYQAMVDVMLGELARKKASSEPTGSPAKAEPAGSPAKAEPRAVPNGGT
jgi:hypothetical protein